MVLSAFKKGISFPITADTSGLKEGLADAQGQLEGADAKSQSFLSKNRVKIGVGMTAMGAGILGFAGLATNAAVGFETKMAEVFTLMPGMTKEAMDAMSDEVRSLSVEMGVLPDELVPALYQAISAGIPAENVFDFMKTANEAAVGGVTDLETAVDGITSVVNAYGDDAIAASEASDLMFTAVKLGKTTFEELSGALFNVIPTASALDMEFGNITAAFASITAQGVPTKVASTQLRQTLVELSKEGGKAAIAFQDLSGKTFKEFIASGGNLQDALQIMEKGAEDLGLGVNDMFSSVEAGGAVLALTGKGTEKFSDSLAAMGEAGGATGEAFATMDETAGRSMAKMMAVIEDLKLELGDVFLPILKDDILPILKTLLGVFSGIPDSLKPVILLVGALGAGMVVLGPLLIAGPGIIAALTTAFTLISAHPIILAVGLLIAALIYLESEFGIVTIAVGIVTDALTWLYDNTLGPFITVLGEVTAGVDIFGIALDILLLPIKLVTDAIGLLGIDWGGVWGDMSDAATEGSGWIGDKLGFVAEGVKDLGSKFADLVMNSDFVSDALAWVSETMSGLIGWIKDGIDKVGGLENAFLILLGPIGWIKIAMEKMGITWTDVWDTMLAVAKPILNTIIDGINLMVGGLNLLNFQVPSWVPFIGGESIGFNLQKLPRLAEGAIVTEPTAAIIGEEGPEAVVPLSSGGGLGNVSITVEQMNVRDDQDIQLIARELHTLISRENRGRGAYSG